MEMKLWACYGIAFLLALTILIPEGCAQDTSCLNQLVPCLKYLNGTREPPESCCKPLKSVIKSNPKCLCSLRRLASMWTRPNSYPEDVDNMSPQSPVFQLQVCISFPFTTNNLLHYQNFEPPNFLINFVHLYFR